MADMEQLARAREGFKPAARVAVEERRDRVLALWLERRYSRAEIAERVGVTPSTISRDLKRKLAEVATLCEDTAARRADAAAMYRKVIDDCAERWTETKQVRFLDRLLTAQKQLDMLLGVRLPVTRHVRLDRHDELTLRHVHAVADQDGRAGMATNGGAPLTIDAAARVLPDGDEPRETP